MVGSIVTAVFPLLVLGLLYARTGKGDKERLLPATTELVAELSRFRGHYGLAALPYGGETTPLLLPIGGAHRTLTRDGVHLIIKQVFDNAIDHLQPTGDAHGRATERLLQASTRWLRHTAGSHMMDGQVTCNTCGTTWGMNRSRPPVNTCTRTATGIAQQRPD